MLFLPSFTRGLLCLFFLNLYLSAASYNDRRFRVYYYPNIDFRLRLQKLKDDMAETDLMYPTKEDPIQGIFEDISEMASNKSDSNLTAPGEESITSNSDSVVHV